jgi:uncharacterized Rmd1/YagE family protein
VGLRSAKGTHGSNSKILAKIPALNQRAKKPQELRVRKLGGLVETRSITHVLEAWVGFFPTRSRSQMNQDAQITKRRRVRAFLLSDRIDTANLEHDGVVSTTPVTYRFGKDGFVTLFRYGVVVTLCLSPEEEEQVLRSLGPRLVRTIVPAEEETLLILSLPPIRTIKFYLADRCCSKQLRRSI